MDREEIDRSFELSRLHNIGDVMDFRKLKLNETIEMFCSNCSLHTRQVYEAKILTDGQTIYKTRCTSCGSIRRYFQKEDK